MWIFFCKFAKTLILKSMDKTFDLESAKAQTIAVLADMRISAYDSITSQRMFAKVFNSLSEKYSLAYDEDSDDGSFILKSSEVKTSPLKLNGEKIEISSTINALVDAFNGFKVRWLPSFSYVIGNNVIIDCYYDIDTNSIDSICVTTNRDDLDEILQTIVNCLDITDSVNAENSYKIAYKGQYSIETTTCKFNDWDSDIKKNYNDDIPYERMNEIIRADKAGLIMMSGEPGTGKTSLIKSLINDNRNVDFIFVDASVCQSISDGMFLDFLQERGGSVLVFEDCEKLLLSRDEVMNESIGTILNLTDGIIAESMKIKFICTFNCDESKIDPAMLRKGRLSMRYDFKKLSLEKTKAIYPSATTEMTLADAYNAEVENVIGQRKRVKIGF